MTHTDKTKRQQTEKERQFTIGEFAKLTGVTGRTLRFYDRKGLLKPSSRNEYGHRFYTDKDLIQLQKIVTFKFMDFSLEDILTFLNRPEPDFAKSLSLQVELLEQKRKQLDHVLHTIERIRCIVEGAGEVDTDLLLLLIGSLQNEQRQKEWMAEHMPSSFVQAVFMELVEPEVKLELERRMTALLVRLHELFRQGKAPQDEEAQQAGQELLALLNEVVGPALEKLNEGELAQMKAMQEPTASWDPILFPQMFDAEKERFLEQVFEQLNSCNVLKGEKPNGNG